jgi:hypothetical protein
MKSLETYVLAGILVFFGIIVVREFLRDWGDFDDYGVEHDFSSPDWMFAAYLAAVLAAAVCAYAFVMYVIL